MTSKQKLLDTLTAHISLYHHHSQTQNLTIAPNPNTRTAVLRWFASLSPHQRRAHLTILDAKFISILLQMHHKLQSNGPGRFIVLPDLPQDDNTALPTLCYRKSEGLLRRSYESDVAQRAVRESIHLFSSREGEEGGSGESRCLGLDSMCVAEGLVEDVDRFVEVADRVSGGEFLREEGELGGEWVEMVWLKGRGYYGLEEFVVNRIEVALRLAWLGCGGGGGRKRGVRLKERLGAAGLAANLYWRKKGCIDWWEKLDVSVKRKVYCAYLGKAARSLVRDFMSDGVCFFVHEFLSLCVCGFMVFCLSHVVESQVAGLVSGSAVV